MRLFSVGVSDLKYMLWADDRLFCEGFPWDTRPAHFLSTLPTGNEGCPGWSRAEGIFTSLHF